MVLCPLQNENQHFWAYIDWNFFSIIYIRRFQHGFNGARALGDLSVGFENLIVWWFQPDVLFNDGNVLTENLPNNFKFYKTKTYSIEIAGSKLTCAIIINTPFPVNLRNNYVQFNKFNLIPILKLITLSTMNHEMFTTEIKRTKTIILSESTLCFMIIVHSNIEMKIENSSNMYIYYNASWTLHIYIQKVTLMMSYSPIRLQLCLLK